MENKISTIVDNLGTALLENPFYSIMIVDAKLTIVWHNKKFAQFMGDGEKSYVGQKCFEAAASPGVHKGCPTQIALLEGAYTRGLYDFGEQNGLIMTIPLPDGYAAKLLTTLPKEAKGEVEKLVK